MASEWRVTSLGDLIDIKHGFAFKGQSIRDEPRGDVLLTPGNFAVGGGFKGQKFKYYDGLVPEEFVLRKGDLIVTMTDLSKQSDTLGYPAFVPACTDGRRYLHNQRLGKISLKDIASTDARFIYYVMCGAGYRHEVLASATGTTVKHTSPNRIKRFRFPVPALAEQRAIAHILGTLDDKIELNRQMNQTLEEMAWALFTSWFVDFDPVHAKATLRHEHHAATPSHGESGWSVEQARAYLESMDPDIAAVFPDSFVDSELGPIPAGWKCGVLDDVVELLSGGTPKTSVTEYWDGNIPWYTARDAPSLSDVFVLETERRITQPGVENSAAKILPEQTTIITARGTVGRLACLGRPMAMNQTCYGIRGARGYPAFFTYWNVRLTVDELQRRTHGTIFDTITRQTFKLVNSIIPPVELAGEFEKTILPVMTRILGNLHDFGSLAALRDTLLPKLMSGQVYVGANRLPQRGGA